TAIPIATSSTASSAAATRALCGVRAAGCTTSRGRATSTPWAAPTSRISATRIRRSRRRWRARRASSATSRAPHSPTARWRSSPASSPPRPACSGARLEHATGRAGADTGAAFSAEPVGGSSTGASTPRPEYFRTIREICDRHDVLFVADEILCGAGRTGSWWAIEPYGVAPDLMTLGKGISGGYAALSAVAAPERIVDVIANGSGSLLHGQTFSFHPVACAAGLAAVRLLKRDRLVERCAKLGRVLQRRLATLAELPHVGDV